MSDEGPGPQWPELTVAEHGAAGIRIGTTEVYIPSCRNCPMVDHVAHRCRIIPRVHYSERVVPHQCPIRRGLTFAMIERSDYPAALKLLRNRKRERNVIGRRRRHRQKLAAEIVNAIRQDALAEIVGDHSGGERRDEIGEIIRKLPP